MSTPTLKSPAPSTTSEPTAKRKRNDSEPVESESDASESSSEEGETILQRLILVTVNTSIERVRRVRQSVVRDKRDRKILMFIPEHIVRQIPKYNALLEDAEPEEQTEGDPDFEDGITHNHRAFVQTIEFIGGVSLRPLTGPAEAIKGTLTSLVGMYGVGVALEIQTLQDAVLDHIESCPDMPVEVFLDFAKLAYDGDEHNEIVQHATDSPIGKLIKRKLAILLPQLLQSGVAQRIKAEGGTLSTELLEVMIEHFSGKGGIKVE